jgi:hypothetical protein
MVVSTTFFFLSQHFQSNILDMLELDLFCKSNSTRIYAIFFVTYESSQVDHMATLQSGLGILKEKQSIVGQTINSLRCTQYKVKSLLSHNPFCFYPMLAC